MLEGSRNCDRIGEYADAGQPARSFNHEWFMHPNSHPGVIRRGFIKAFLGDSDKGSAGARRPFSESGKNAKTTLGG